MTDRLKGCTVTFDHDIRNDDADPILDAIRQIRGVLHVEPNIVTFDDHTAEVRARTELARRLIDLARDLTKG
jgi:hypothetical protein